MDLLTGSVRSIYFKYLSAAFGSALTTSIYSMVDMAAVGQYQGPEGTAALAVVAPLWNLVYSLGLMAGIGGGVLFSTARGRKKGDENQFFTASVLLGTLVSALCWAAIVFYEEPLLRLFGGTDDLIPLAREYLSAIRFAVPLFPFSQILASFLRNDGDPALATGAVLLGGVCNMVGDYLFVFPLGMGVYGAGLATALGGLVTDVVMIVHFLRRRNTLRLCRVRQLTRRTGELVVSGFSAFFVDAAMGILTILFNRQIVRYAGTDALAVYGVVVNISTFVQCCAYSVGQASQPIFSVNFGAGKGDRIRAVLRLALATVAVIGVAWTAAVWLLPVPLVRVFMKPTAAVLAVAPGILRRYGLSFLLLPLNIFSTYYFQSLLRPGIAFAVSVGRGAVVSGALILLLPALMGADSLWFAMPITELVVAAAVLYKMSRCTRSLTA